MTNAVNTIDAVKDLLVIMFITSENFDDVSSNVIRRLDDIKDVILDRIAASGAADISDISAHELAEHLFAKYGV